MTLAVIVKGYPRLSETFIAQELLGLQRRGFAYEIWSLRHPTDPAEHPVHREIAAPRRYLPEYLRNEPLRVLRAVLALLPRRSFWRAAAVWLRDLARSRDFNRIRRFGQAAVLARELPPDTSFLYAHFLHTPSSVTRYAATIRGIGWGVSAHAKDIWTTPEWEKREKLADCAFCVTCTRYGADHLESLAPPERVALVYHGLDLGALPAPPVNRDTGGPLRLLSVGRLVEKKGYRILLDALALLPNDIEWRLVHIGGGGDARRLSELAETHGIAARIEWRGAQPREAVIAAMREAQLFVLPSRIAKSGDRDGLPNVLMEAASQKLPVLSTEVAAIPEFVTSGESGVLVPPDDTEALAEAIQRMAASPEARAAMADRLHARLLAEFRSEPGIDTVAERLSAELA